MRYLAYGLDFGTTHSAISVADAEGKAKVLPLGGADGQIIRSVLFFSQKTADVYVGQEAIDKYLAEGMQGRLLQSIKSALADENFSGTMINGKRYELEDLIALVISYLKNRADAYLGQNIDRVVLGRPAIFSADPKKEKLARERLIRAAQKAGFKEVCFQLEPIAAALHYETSLKQPQKVLIADLGGGTSDFTLMDLSPDRVRQTERDADILQTDGVYVGGDNLDARIMWGKVVKYFGAAASYRSGAKWLHVPHRLIGSICDWRRLSFIRDDREEQELIKMISRAADDKPAIARLQSLINNNLGYALARRVEAAKCDLSDQEQTEISFAAAEIVIKEPLTRPEFEELIGLELEKIKDCMQQLLAGGGYDPAEINSVFLTGGTSRVPAMRRIFETEFGAAKVVPGDAFISVASGLALSAKLFFDVNLLYNFGELDKNV